METETRAVIAKRDVDEPSSTLSVVTGNGLTASMSSGNLASAQSGSPTQTATKNDPQRLDFIGSSTAVKKLFSMSLTQQQQQQQQIDESPQSKKETLIAVHNFDGTLIIDDAEDESNYEVFHSNHNHQASEYHIYNDNERQSSTTALLPPSSQSLALALRSNDPKDSLSMLSSIVQNQKDDTAVSSSSSSNGQERRQNSALLAPPTPPRDYLRWEFQGQNMLLGHDALVVRSPEGSSDFAVRVEDAMFLRSVWEAFQQQQQQQQQQQHPPLLRDERSYAQALLQENETVSQVSSSTILPKSNNSQVDNDKDDSLLTCIVPFHGPLGGKLSPPSPAAPSESTPPALESSPALSIVLDAYLDNLMANVPQLALCLEEKGFIQSVKMLPTEEIPSRMLHPSTLDTSFPLDVKRFDSSATTELEESIFSPQIMESNASALLRFLKTNCTRNNSTYLLRHEEGKVQNIQLYDISSISTQKQKKWIWWLSTMSHRFALRLRHLETSGKLNSESQKRAIRDRQRSLLQQTLDLLQDLMDIDGKAHESMVASVREHMADTYLSSTMATCTESSTEESCSTKNQETSASPPVVTATLSTPPSSVVLPANSATLLQQPPYDQAYAALSVDALNKAQDHLVKGIKVLNSLYEEEIRQQQDQKRSRRRRQRSQATPKPDTHPQKLSPAMVLQLYGMNFKLVNISLRLAEHHLGNYYSSSAMQALRTAAKRLNDAAKLLLYWKSSTHSRDEERQKSLQLQYIWLLEHCGHFARSFASDELWRDRGHASGEDVISVLTDVETVFGDDLSIFGDMEEDRLLKKSKGTIGLCNLSGVVAPSNRIETAIREAKTVLQQEPLLRRERRRVLVASCVLYSRAITAFSCCTSEKTVLLNLLRQRLGDACNETGKVLLAALRTHLRGNNRAKNQLVAAEALLDSAEFWFTVGLEAFGACADARNLALLRCNLCQSFKLRANSGFKKGEKSSKHAEDCLQMAADELLQAHVDLGVRDKDPQTWDMVSEELAATFLVLGVRRRQSLLGSGNAPNIFIRLSPGEERSIVDPMERALKIYEHNNQHQAAAVHYQLALTFSKLWTCQRDESMTRKKLSKAFDHFRCAFDYFSAHSLGNEPTFCLLCLDLASLYAAIPGEEGQLKSLGCCLDCCDTFSLEFLGKKERTNDWYETMETIAESVDDRVFKLLRSLAKADPNRYKDMYREGLTAKMVKNVYEDERSAALLALHEVLLAVKKVYGIIVSK